MGAVGLGIMLKRDSKNRRRQQRQLLNTAVQVFSGTTHVAALGINVSDVGMCLFTLADLPVGGQIEVEFVPPRSKQATRVPGTIRHRALYLYGIEFVPEPEDLSHRSADADVVSR